jgi:hypothetical protein
MAAIVAWGSCVMFQMSASGKTMSGKPGSNCGSGDSMKKNNFKMTFALKIGIKHAPYPGRRYSMSRWAMKNSLLALENTTTRMSVSLACSVSTRFARSDWTWKSKRLMVEKVLLITTFRTPEELLVWSVPKDGYRAAVATRERSEMLVRWSSL